MTNYSKALAPFLLLQSLTFVKPEAAVAISTTGSTFHGLHEGAVDSFLGIQYAEVGKRFSRSTLLSPSIQDPINATSFGPDCHQVYRGLPNFIHQEREEAEECLYLNLWRPTDTTTSEGGKPLSTMVWIHGGGFALGSGASEVSRGHVLAQEQNVLIVSINYRLGALGFLPQDDTGFGGMNGLYDQILALEWLRDNIAAFGGSPDDITVLGESAGAEAICMLSVSPLATGLFKRAILQSGECINNNWATGIPSDDISYGLGLVDQLLNATGVSSVDELADASQVSAFDLQVVHSLPLGWPVVILDEEVLPQHPRDLYKDLSNVVPKDILVGSNSFEDVTFMGVTPETYLSLSTNLPGWITGMLGAVYDTQVLTDLSNAYDPEIHFSGDTVKSLAKFNGDYYIGCPTLEFARILSKTIAPVEGSVYLYDFSHFAFTDPAVHMGYLDVIDTSSWASHMAEIPFVFGTLDFSTADNFDVTEADRALRREIQTRWANFAKTGNPNVATTEVNMVMATWNPVQANDSKEIAILVFEGGSSREDVATAHEDQCSAFPFVSVSNDNSGDGKEPTSAPTSKPDDDDGESSSAAHSSVVRPVMAGVLSAFFLSFSL